MVAVGVVTLIPALLALIYIGSSTVFSDVVSLSVSGFYASYFLPCSLLLWRRMTGQIADFGDPVVADDVVGGPAGEKVLRMKLVWGPWRVRGLLGTINNAFACVYMLFVVFWDFWPPTTPVTLQTMNYSVVVTSGVIIFSIIYYFAHGRTQYIGPLIDSEVLTERALREEKSPKQGKAIL